MAKNYWYLFLKKVATLSLFVPGRLQDPLRLAYYFWPITGPFLWRFSLFSSQISELFWEQNVCPGFLINVISSRLTDLVWTKYDVPAPLPFANIELLIPVPQEAMTRISLRKSAVSEEHLTQIFCNADMDEDGYLSYKEAKRAYKKLAKLYNRPTDTARGEEK